MDSVGLRELRQNASEIVRRVEAGEQVEVTVAGRPSAILVPAAAHRWRTWADIEAIFEGPTDAHWEHDRALIDHDVRDPFAPR